MKADSVTIDGLQLPTPLAGHPALEFCNTLAGWNGGVRHDYLQSYDHLVAWAGHVGLLDPARAQALAEEARRRPRIATRSLQRALALREALYPVLTHGPADPGFTVVATAVQTAARRLRLVPTDGAARLALAPDAGLDAPIDAAAWSAGQLLTSADVGLIHACPGASCGWLFLDRRGRRRWCSMATCGNRAKAQRFSERHRDP